MLTIRTSQMSALEDAMVSGFAETVSDYVARIHADRVRGLSRDEILQRSRDALRAGRGTGLSDRADLKSFVALSFIFGPRFYLHPSISGILADKASGGQRMRTVMEAMRLMLDQKGLHSL